MKYQKGTFSGFRNYQLSFQSWIPETSARAVVWIAHGIVEHAGRYRGLGEFLADQGLAVYSFDFRHHGLSEGQKGCIDNFSFIQEDLALFLGLIQKAQPGRRVFLLGHSMGASLSLAFTSRQQSALAGLIVSGSPLRIQPSMPTPLVGLMYPLALATPNLGLIRLDSRTLSRDSGIVTGYDSDPLVFRGKLSCRLILSFLWSLHQVEAELKQIRIPVLILHGSQDHLCSPEGSSLVHQKIGSKDKTLSIYSGLYHEILNEPEKDRVRGDITEWINKRT
jgi:acylglycerol lipase